MSATVLGGVACEGPDLSRCPPHTDATTWPQATVRCWHPYSFPATAALGMDIIERQRHAPVCATLPRRLP